MDAGDYSYNVPSFVPPIVDADVVPNRFRFRAMYESMMRNDIMRMAGDVKGFFPLPFEAAATAAETNDYSAEDAVRAFNQISGDSGVVEFQSIVGKLPIDDLWSLMKFMEGQYRMMLMSEHNSYYIPWHGFLVDADNLVPGRLRAAFEPTMRKNIMKMAGKVKGFFPTLVETANTEAAATAAGTNYGVEDAVRALRRMSGGGDGDSGVVEFQSIVGKLPIDDLQTLEKLLEEPYHVMLRSEMGFGNPYLFPTTWRPEVKLAASGGGDSFATKFAGQAIGAMLTKVVGGAVFGAFDPTTVEPFELEKAMGAMGLMSVIGGMVVQDKKPGLSRAMVKFGSVAIALAMIGPMAGSLENVIMAWVFAVLAAAIVAVTATFA